IASSVALPTPGASRVVPADVPGGPARVSAAFTIIQPDRPGRVALCMHSVELDLVFECVHRFPEPRVSIGEELPLLNQALERDLHELLTFPQNVKNSLPEHEEATIDPEFRLAHAPQVSNHTALLGVNRVEALGGAHAQKAGGGTAAKATLQVFVERQVCKSVRVVRQKSLLPFQISFHSEQTLPDVRVQPRVYEGYAPVV